MPKKKQKHTSKHCECALLSDPFYYPSWTNEPCPFFPTRKYIQSQDRQYETLQLLECSCGKEVGQRIFCSDRLLGYWRSSNNTTFKTILKNYGKANLKGRQFAHPLRKQRKIATHHQLSKQPHHALETGYQIQVQVQKQGQSFVQMMSIILILFIFFPQMKQSSRRSKETLKASLDPKKPVVDYQQYEEQLETYQENKRANSLMNMFDWTKPSEVISLKQSERKQPSPQRHQEVMQNNSMNTDELLQSDQENKQQQHGEYLDDSFDVQVPNNSPTPTFVDLIKRDYGDQYRNMSNNQIEGELKSMREKIMEMNEKLNRMLDRYELMGMKHVKKEAQINNPHKFLSKEIEINNKILATQADQIKQIQEKDKQLEKKDYLVQLNELIIQIGKEIHDTGKDKHHRWVDVQRIDRLLKEIQDIQGTEEEYRQVKELKIKIVFYFKKLKAQKTQEEDLDIEIDQLTIKDAEISKEYDRLTQLAVQKSLDVSTNKKYLELKKRYEELVVLADSARKKKDIAVKSQQVAEEKLQRQIEAMKKELQKIEMQTQQHEYKSITVDQQTNQLISKHNVLNRDIKSVSYRFDQSLLHSQRKFKPDFKRISRKQGSSKDANRTINTDTLKNNKFQAVNDKNITIDQSSSNAERSDVNQSKMKPMLRQWKGKSQNQRYPQSPAQKYKTLEASNIFKPPLMLRSKK